MTKNQKELLLEALIGAISGAVAGVVLIMARRHFQRKVLSGKH